jgi:hypothetical protein
LVKFIVVFGKQVPAAPANFIIIIIIVLYSHDDAHTYRFFLYACDEKADSSGEEPMVVVYRLAGLDGEATEDIVDDLPDANATQLDPEEEFRVAAPLAGNGGLAALLRLLAALRDFEREGEMALVLLRLLTACAKLRINRRALVRLHAADTALRQLRRALTSNGESSMVYIYRNEGNVALALNIFVVLQCVCRVLHMRCWSCWRL